MTAVGYEETTSRAAGHGESTPSSGRKILVPDTGKDDPKWSSDHTRNGGPQRTAVYNLGQRRSFW